MEIDVQPWISVANQRVSQAYLITINYSDISSMRMVLMPQGLITLSIHAARLYVSAYFRPLLKKVAQKKSQPFLYDKHNEVLISYDNEDSFSMVFILCVFIYDTD